MAILILKKLKVLLLLMVVLGFIIQGDIFLRTSKPAIFTKLTNVIFQSRKQDTSLQKSSTKDPCVDIYELDPKKPASASKSKMVLLSTVSKSFQLGDNITVRITLYDHNGQAKLVGGDRVRVWKVDKSKKASSAGNVIDHGNDSYTGYVKALWVGNPVIRCLLAITCEAIGMRHHVIKEPGKLTGMVGVFKWKNISEETKCTPSLDFKGDFCNFTAENYGLPLFCVRPKNKDLLCHDWVEMRGAYLFKYSSEERVLIKGHKRLKPDIGVTVKAKGTKKVYVSPPSEPCNRIPIARTWQEQTPVGFFFKGKWRSTYCSYTIEDTATAYTKCVQNRRINLIGDSTTRQWFMYLERLFHSVRVGTYQQHKPLLSVDAIHNITLLWAMHGYPVLHQVRPLSKAYSIPPHVYLDKLPGGCNDIVIIHLYVHFHVYDAHILRLQVRAIVTSVTNLMARSPNVTIAIKGPHAFGYVYILPEDDYWASVYRVIIKTELAPVRDKVIYLYCWDITVASENNPIHNSKFIDKEMLHNVFNRVCRRELKTNQSS